MRLSVLFRCGAITAFKCWLYFAIIVVAFDIDSVGLPDVVSASLTVDVQNVPLSDFSEATSEEFGTESEIDITNDQIGEELAGKEDGLRCGDGGDESGLAKWVGVSSSG